MQESNLKTIDIFGQARLDLYFSYLEQCKGIKQMKKYHPEGDVFNHSLQCLHWALKESNDIDCIFAAMLHDIGKIEKSKGHEKIAVNWLRDVCSVKTLWMIEHHMRIWYLLLGDMKRRQKVNELAQHCWLPELIMLARWDKLARNPARKIKYDKQEIVSRMDKCINSHFILDKGALIDHT